MNANHSAFFDQPDGAALRRALSKPELIPQYELLSRIELPAVQAAVWEIEPLLAKFDKKTRDYAIQSSGALIGDILTARGYRVARDAKGEKRRGRVRNARFVTTGTIWEKPDNDGSQDARVREILDDLLVRYRTTLEALAR